MAITRLALRQEIGRLTTDMFKVKATATGSTTTLKDALRLARSDGNMVGRIGWVSAGTSANLGKMVRITGSDKSAQTITFADTALPQSTVADDEMELWNRAGQGFFPDDVNTEINSALSIVASQVTTPDEDEQTFDYDAPYLDIPEDWRFFGGALYQHDVEHDIWREIPVTDTHMIVDVRNRTVRLKGEIARKAHNKTVRLFGDVPSQPLSTDASTTSCDAEWLSNYVAARLLLEQMGRTDASRYEDVSTRYSQCKMAEKEARGKARNRPSGAALRLW